MNQKGVTLLELLVVMVIISIGAALTTPNIGGWMTNYRLRSAAREVASALRLAQIKAVSTNTPHQVVFDTVNDSYIIQYRDTTGAWVTEGGNQTLPTGVQINTNFGNVAIFASNSTATDGGGNVIPNGDIRLNNTRGTTKAVRLLGLTGRIKIE